MRLTRRARTRAVVITGALVIGIIMAMGSLGAQTFDNYPDLVSDPPEDVGAPEVISWNGEDLFVVRFDGFVTNVGDGPLHIQGNPQPTAASGTEVAQHILDSGGNTTARFPLDVTGGSPDVQYENSDGHEHWHLMRIMEYSLWDESLTQQVTPGEKIGFCLWDIQRVSGSASGVYNGGGNWCAGNGYTGGGPNATYLEMGVTEGWRDVYSSSISLQWVDVSDVAPGNYYLSALSDPNDIVEESDETNNDRVWTNTLTVVPGYLATDVNGGTVGAATTINLAADVYGSPGARRFTIESAPSHGSLDVAVGGVITGSAVVYTPDPGYDGPDSFTFSAYDDDSAYPTNPDPAAVTATASVTVDTSVVSNLLDDFETATGWTSDPDGTDTGDGVGAWERSLAEYSERSGSVVQPGSSTSGSFSLNTNGATGNTDVDGGVESARSPGFALPAGTQTLTLDYFFAHTGASSGDYFSVSIAGGGLSETLLQVNGSATDRAASWTTVSFDVSAYAGETVTLLVEAADDASSGAVVEAGVDTIRITVAANTAPTVTDPGDQTSTVGDDVSLQIVASDDDGDTLTYSAVELPNGLDIDPSTGLISGTVADNESPWGTIVSVDDGTETTTVSFTWTVDDAPPTNTAPQVDPIADQTNDEGDVVSVQIGASDDDGDALTYAVSGLPDGVSADANGLISGTIAAGAAGGYTIDVDVSDGTDTTSIGFAWTVNTPSTGTLGCTAVLAGSTLTVSIDQVPEASAYSVYRRGGNGNGYLYLGYLTGDTLVYENLPFGTGQDIVMKAIFTDGTRSDPIPCGEVDHEDPDANTVLGCSASLIGTTLTVDIDTVPDASAYSIYRKSGNGNTYLYLGYVVGDTLVFDDLPFGTGQLVTLKAIYSDGTRSDEVPCGSVDLVDPDGNTVLGCSVSIDGATLTVSIDTISDANAYSVSRAGGGGNTYLYLGYVVSDTLVVDLPAGTGQVIQMKAVLSDGTRTDNLVCGTVDV